MENKLKVLYIRPMKQPELIEIKEDLTEMQRLVGGTIEVYMPFDDDAAIVCNEEGKMRRLPLNRAVYAENGQLGDIIAGNFFICNAPVYSESFQSLSDSQIKKYTERFLYPERFTIAGNGKIVAEKIMPRHNEIER